MAAALDFLRRRVTGSYEVDEFGFDPDLTEHVLLPMIRPWYEKWFRVEATGLDHVPGTGPALVAANHSGSIAIDSVMTWVALRDHHPAHRYLRMLGADLVFRTPLLGEFARKAGHTLACNADTERLFAAGELVGVWPEGYKGTGKLFSERYRLRRFGRGGFVSVAVRAGVPIVPCSIVGAEEAYPMLANAGVLARLLGLPYFPITPTFPGSARPGPSRCRRSGSSSSANRSTPGSSPAAPTTRTWSPASPTRSATPSSRRSTGWSRGAGGRSADRRGEPAAPRQARSGRCHVPG